jgi:autotransporter-associated beta strand protein
MKHPPLHHFLIVATTMIFQSFSPAHAQLNINNAASTYTIDFTNTVTGVNSGAFLGTGFQATPAAGQLDSDAWALTGWSNGNLAFGGTQTTAAIDYTRGAATAAVSTGGMYAFSGGNITTGTALGFQPGGSDFAPGTLTLRAQNTTGLTISGFDFSYLLYVRNDQARSSSFNFSWSLDNTTYTPIGALDFTSTAASDALGFVSNNRSTTFSSLTLADQALLYFRWSSADVGGSGSRDEFALDNISLTNFTTVAGSTSLFWLGDDTARGGAGTWENSGGTAWSSTDADGTGTAWDSTKAAIFNTSPATVTLSGIVDVNKGITFATGTDGSTISGGTALNLGGATAADNTISTASGVTASITSTITGTANGLTKSGDGALILGSSNSFVGTVNVSAGTLSISSDDQLGDTANDIVLGGILKTTTSIAMNAGRDLSGTGTLDIAPSTTLTVNGNISTSSLTLSNTGTASLAGTNSVGALSITGNTTVQGTAISLTGLTSTHTGTASVSNNLTFSSGDKTVSVPASVTLSLTGTVTAPGRILKIGTGTLELASDNTTLVGGARLGASSGSPTDGGILKIGHKNSLGAPTSTFQFNYGTLNATTTLTGVNAIPNPLSIGGRTGAAAVISGSDIEFTGDFGFFRGGGSATGQMVVNVDNTTTLSGNVIAIAGGGGAGAATGLTLGGTGKLVLGGNWSLNDLLITVADSLTLVTNTTVTSALNVGPTSTLGGNGTISGPTTIEGTHNPGNSPGIQIFGSDLTYSGGASVVNWELIGNTTSGRGTNFDGIDVGGTLNFAGATTLNLSFNTPLGVLWSDLLWATNQSWLLYDVTSPVSNFSNLGINPTNWQDSSGALFNTALAGSTFTLSQTDNDIYLNYTAVPEPSRALLLGLGGLGLIFRRRRQ